MFSEPLTLVAQAKGQRGQVTHVYDVYELIGCREPLLAPFLYLIGQSLEAGGQQ